MTTLSPSLRSIHSYIKHTLKLTDFVAVYLITLIGLRWEFRVSFFSINITFTTSSKFCTLGRKSDNLFFQMRTAAALSQLNRCRNSVWQTQLFWLQKCVEVTKFNTKLKSTYLRGIFLLSLAEFFWQNKFIFCCCWQADYWEWK